MRQYEISVEEKPMHILNFTWEHTPKIKYKKTHNNLFAYIHYSHNK